MSMGRTAGLVSSQVVVSSFLVFAFGECSWFKESGIRTEQLGTKVKYHTLPHVRNRDFGLNNGQLARLGVSGLFRKLSVKLSKKRIILET